MKIQLIIIGSEVLNGHTRDAHLYWLSRTLNAEWGLELEAVQVLRDDKASLKEALKKSLQKYPLTLTTGGLGPTPDDLTLSVAAEVLDSALYFNQDSYDMALGHYQRLRETAKIPLEFDENHPYAQLPAKGAKPLHNPVGLAPGLMCTKGGHYWLAFPGVPREMQSMVFEHVPTTLKQLSHTISRPQRMYFQFRYIPEEILFKKAPKSLSLLQSYGSFQSLPHSGGVEIIALGDAEKLKACERALQAELAQEYPTSLWQTSLAPALSVPAYLLRACKERGLTVSTAESCTGGAIASALTDIPGSSEVLLGGVVSYANQIKYQLLKVEQNTFEEVGAVSERCAREMVQGLFEQTGADLNISVTGILGPSGGSEEKPVGTVYFGLLKKNDADNLLTFKRHFRGDRLKMKEKVATHALHLLLEHGLGL